MKKAFKIRAFYIFLLGLALIGCFWMGYQSIGDHSTIDSQKESRTVKETAFTSYADKISELVKTNWPVMDKVWPTYNYKNHNLIIFYLDKKGNVKEARMLNADENKSLAKKDYEQLTAPNPKGYDQVDFQGKPSIVMSVDDQVIESKDSVSELYKTATHELVHFYYQGDIEASAESTRNQIYPIEQEPRVTRAMLYKRLIQAFENPENEEYLGKAKFWLDKYRTEFKSEADGIRVTDIAEATARYTENMGSFVGQNLSQTEARKEAEKYIKKDDIFIAADKESYEIGYVAALIFDDKQPNWKETFYAANKGVEEVLLDSVPAIPDEADKSLVDKISEKIRHTNQEAKTQLQDIIAAHDDIKIPYLQIDVSKASKSFYAENMFSYQGLSVMAGYSSSFKVAGHEVTVNDTAIISGYEEENQYIKIPLTMPHAIKNNKLTVRSDNLTLKDVPVKESQEEGRTIYSVQAQD